MTRCLMAALRCAAFGVAVMGSVLPAVAEETLRVCLNEDIPPYSFREGNKAGGFDLAVAEAVAKRLGRRLAIQWFETGIDSDSSFTIQANALLSDGRCQLVAGYPLYRDGLGKPGAETGRLPGFAGAKPEDRRRRVALGELVPTKPYFYAPLTVVLSGAVADKQISSLGDLTGLRLGVNQTSLSDAILMRYGAGKFVDQITHFIPGRSELFPRMESGEIDATLVELRRFDDYRDRTPDTKLKASGYFHKIGFNMGYVTLGTEQPLIEAVNAAIADLIAKGELEAMAKSSGMTYVAPVQPDVLETIPIVDFFKD
ncbi:MAG: transporter substrate-binding domain-containing protein [Xanthobacteraceae bacterium]|nr:transporter substrate-binding domain-containing protein [Xanthobacteraceae bacterium]